MRKQLVQFPAQETPHRLVVLTAKDELFYTHTVPKGETDHIVKLPPAGEPCTVVLLDGERGIMGARIGNIVESIVELKASPNEPAKATA